MYISGKIVRPNPKILLAYLSLWVSLFLFYTSSRLNQLTVKFYSRFVLLATYYKKIRRSYLVHVYIILRRAAVGLARVTALRRGNSWTLFSTYLPYGDTVQLFLCFYLFSRRQTRKRTNEILKSKPLSRASDSQVGVFVFSSSDVRLIRHS